MKFANNSWTYSPSDLGNHLSCQHITQLNKMMNRGQINKPSTNKRFLEVLRERGEIFERNYLIELQNQGLNIVEIQRDDLLAEQKTLQAMRDGVDIIFQGRLVVENEWAGWSDFIVKVDKSSNLGDWSYEILDTKLTANTRAATILQIVLYSERIGEIQGKLPEFMHVKNPQKQESYRLDEYHAFVKALKKKLKASLINVVESYPEPNNHCDICDWFLVCNKKRREDDHLGFIAGMGKSQIKEVRELEINTLAQMAQTNLLEDFKPTRGHISTFLKLQNQARLQYEARTTGQEKYEFLPVELDKGFNKLPEPNEDDIYFDLEGDPLIDPNGMEYLFGWVYRGTYYSRWCETENLERGAFEYFMDWVYNLSLANPNFHIYHYAPYEVTALKRLSGKYDSKGRELDHLLRNQVFVDLYSVVRNSIQASVEKYSIKDLEKFYGYEREMNLRELGQIKADYEFLIEKGDLGAIQDEMRSSIELYNYDDCISTAALHNWLEGLRQEQINNGIEITRPTFEFQEESDSLKDFYELIKETYEVLMNNLPNENRTDLEQGRFLMAQFLAWHKMEDKSHWWEVFKLREASLEENFDERKALSYLEYTGNSFDYLRSRVYEYKFPIQECELKNGDSLQNEDIKNLGTIHHINYEEGLLQIKKVNKYREIHPSFVFSLDYINPKVKVNALNLLAEWIVENSIDSHEIRFLAARKLLMNKIDEMPQEILNLSDFVEKSTRWALNLNYGILPIQGPPGSGKTHTSAKMILNLIQQGKKIGVTALSHKVITNLLKKIWEFSIESNQEITIIQKVKKDFEEELPWETTKGSPEELIGHVGKDDIIAGTSFLFPALPEDAIDYLVIDEAGQLSLIDIVACATSAKNLILLGDPQQLQQPIQGSHPEGTEFSGLHHILKGKKTIPRERGIFLSNTYRMHPDICEFDSKMFYENKLKSKEFLVNQRLIGVPNLEGSGIVVKFVDHSNNISSSIEEVNAIKEIISNLCSESSKYINEIGEEHQFNVNNIKIISPYNSQVQLLQREIPDIEIGTVDKFQGQEAEVVIYSMATSSAEDAPRGMEFLYSQNRFNVAISRARTLFILVASPGVFDSECKTPNHIFLANPYAEFLEKARILD